MVYIIGYIGACA